jgi:hypothetical protein
LRDAIEVQYLLREGLFRTRCMCAAAWAVKFVEPDTNTNTG